MSYEYHSFEDDKLKLIFHKDCLIKGENEFTIHWHLNPELLFFISGKAKICSDNIETEVEAGELAVIGCDRIHSVTPISEDCSYYCMIPDISYCADSARLPFKSSEKEITALCEKIIYNKENQPPYYREAINGYLTSVFALLSRSCADSDSALEQNDNQKLITVKKVISYIYNNFQKDISLDEISSYVGLSKYYMCHMFKEVTGQTVLRHINFIRCRNARSLLQSGKYNVAQSAYLSGFSNVSYFSKVYTSVYGNLPSSENKAKKK